MVDPEVTLPTMWSSTHFDLPSVEKDPLTNWDTDFLIQCRKCGGREVPLRLFDQHRAWHARTNLLCHLTTFVKDKLRGGSLGPGDLGCLQRLNYEGKHQGLWEMSTEDMDMDDYLKGSCPDLVEFRYIEGLKYTIGNCFKGREEQGEFVILNLDTAVLAPKKDNDDGDVVADVYDWSLVPKENYFELECKDGCIWITNKVEVSLSSSSSRTVVCVNRSPLHKEKDAPRTKLCFGDVITISIHDDGERGRPRRGCDLILTPSTFNPEEDEPEVEVQDMMSPPPHPFGNNLILYNVFRCLPTAMMKDLRLVSHVWNEESLKILKARGTTVSVCHWDGFMLDSVAPLMQISNFAHSFLNRMKFFKWKMELPYFGMDHPYVDRIGKYARSVQHDDHLRTMLEDRLLDDLVWLMDQPHVVTSLNLSGQMGTSPKSWQMYKVVLSGLNDTLSTLKLTLGLLHDPAFPSTAMEFDPLPALRSLTIGLKGKPDSAPLLIHFLKGFLPTVGNIHHLAFENNDLEINNEVNASAGGLDGLLFLKDLIELQCTNPSKFAGLRELKLWCSPLRIIDQLQRMKSLQKLDLLQMNPVPVEFPTALYSALSPHADSLTDLTLHFNCKTGGRLTINFPDQMQHLKSLCLLFQVRAVFSEMVRVRFGTAPAADVLNYNTHFPSLSKLSVWPVKEGRCNEPPGTLSPHVDLLWLLFYRALAPFFRTGTTRNGQRIPVTTVTVLDVPFLLNGKYPGFWDHLETLFPNVEFPPSLEAARRADLRDVFTFPDFDRDL